MITKAEAQDIIEERHLTHFRERGATYAAIYNEYIEEFDRGWLLFCGVQYNHEAPLPEYLYVLLVDRVNRNDMQSSAGDLAVSQTAERLVALRNRPFDANQDNPR